MMERDFQIKGTTAFVNVLKKYMEQVDTKFIVKEMMVRGELIKRNFTKRQLNILWFIFTYSFPFGKDKAVITKLQDFELSGVHKTKVREELDKLIEMNVIEFEEKLHLYGIKDPYEWNAPYHAGHSDERNQDLFLLNLRDANVPIELIIEMMTKLEEERE